MSEVTPNELHVLLVEIRGDVKATKDAVDRHLEDDTRVHSDHELRLRANEKFRWGSSAVIAVIAALGTWGFFA